MPPRPAQATNAAESQRLYGRHFDFKDELVSKISRKSIDVLKVRASVCVCGGGGYICVGLCVCVRCVWGGVGGYVCGGVGGLFGEAGMSAASPLNCPKGAWRWGLWIHVRVGCWVQRPRLRGANIKTLKT